MCRIKTNPRISATLSRAVNRVLKPTLPRRDVQHAAELLTSSRMITEPDCVGGETISRAVMGGRKKSQNDIVDLLDGT